MSIVVHVLVVERSIYDGHNCKVYFLFLYNLQPMWLGFIVTDVMKYNILPRANTTLLIDDFIIAKCMR